MNLDARYRLARGVAVRPERFGGLVYRYDNRRLFFLHSHDLVDFVSGLNGARPLGDALEEFLQARALPESARDIFIEAVARLETLNILDASCPG
jgi:putative mycofactocin binding protein MftB